MGSDPAYSLRGKRVWVAGHRGMVGSAVVRRLAREDCEVVTTGDIRLDLRRQSDTEAWVADRRPDVVVLCAATVGGILANDTRPADFLYDNLMIEANVVAASHAQDVSRLLFLGSSCIYPRLAPQPMAEDSLLTGPLEPTNQWYAVAKIAGIKMTQAYRRQYGRDFISAMPTNLYGPGDNFDLTSSHVLPALIRKAHEAKARGADHLTIWGSGTPLREFLHVDDCADALVFLLETYSGEEHVNVGSGKEVSIMELARLIARVVGFDGPILRDTSKPDGAPRKLMNVDKLSALGWSAAIGLEAGIRSTYDWFVRHGLPAPDRKTPIAADV